MKENARLVDAGDDRRDATQITDAIADRIGKGRFSNEQLLSLGIDFRKGWKKRLVGRWIKNNALAKFFASENVKLTTKDNPRRELIPRHYNKKQDGAVTAEFLAARELRASSGGYPEAKWIYFCREMLARGFSLDLYEARQTYSKYITVSGVGAEPFKVRFSNHMPIKGRELDGDCDFFVGVTHTGTRTTEKCIEEVLIHFGHDPESFYEGHARTDRASQDAPGHVSAGSR